MASELLNFKAYAPLQLAAFSGVFLCWLAVYIIAVRTLAKRKFVQVPGVAWCGFLAWEILWGYVYELNVGPLFAWGVKVFAPLSCYVLWGVVRYSRKQLFPEIVRRYIVPILGFALAAWLVVFYFFIPGTNDSSGMILVAIQVTVMSVQFIQMLLRLFEKEGRAGIEKMSYPASWLMLFANIFGATFEIASHRERRWPLALWCVAVTLSLAYVLIFRQLRMRPANGDLASTG